MSRQHCFAEGRGPFPLTEDMSVGLSNVGATYVARLLGLNRKWGFQRQFYNAPIANKRWSRSGRTGIADVDMSMLDIGVYEVQDWPSMTKKNRSYIRVTDKCWGYIDKDEVMKSIAELPDDYDVY